jgi:membrane protein DedA with SNARE-associated domain/rhodanese-related sulfurtransferase
MHRVLEFLLHHGYIVLLAWVFLEQAGVPIPSLPLLLAAGALAGSHQLNFFASLGIATLSCVVADSLWYQLGHRRGVAVLRLLCRISIEPDSCVRRTEGLFAKQGARSLLFAKFIPGLGTVAPPLAGIFHMRMRRFLLFDALGGALWAATFLTLGYAFSGEIEHIAEWAGSLGSGLAVLVLGSLAGYLCYKIISRHRFLRELRIARITVDELKTRMDAGEEVVVVDLRHSVEFEADPEIIPGALHMDDSALEENDELLPRDQEVVLYCTCPNEATSARVALLLRKKGVKRIRPLQGGLAAWRERGYPVANTKLTQISSERLSSAKSS